MLIKYLPKMRGMTCYPDGARGGQPLTPVKYQTAMKHLGEVFVEATDICDITQGRVLRGVAVRDQRHHHDDARILQRGVWRRRARLRSIGARGLRRSSSASPRRSWWSRRTR
jgi:hypothetical protein